MQDGVGRTIMAHARPSCKAIIPLIQAIPLSMTILMEEEAGGHRRRRQAVLGGHRSCGSDFGKRSWKVQGERRKQTRVVSSFKCLEHFITFVWNKASGRCTTSRNTIRQDYCIRHGGGKSLTFEASSQSSVGPSPKVNTNHLGSHHRVLSRPRDLRTCMLQRPTHWYSSGKIPH